MAPFPRHGNERNASRNWRLPLFLLSSLTFALASCTGPQAVREYPTILRCPDCPVLSVTRVIDGDTFVSPTGRVRLFGVDTPERGMPCFAKASRGLRQLAGRKVRVERGPRGMDPVGRRLFYVYTLDGNSIDEILVTAGLARAWTRDGQHRGDLTALETRARRAGEGCLWSTDKDR